METTIDEARFSEALSISGAFAEMARLFATPLEKAQIATLRGGEALDHLAEYLGVLDVDAQEDISRLRAALMNGSLEEVDERLNIESTRLFHVRLPEPPAIPYESVWREPERLTMGRAARATAAIYRERGLYPSEEFGDTAPDHIARELDFVAIAARKEALALQDGDTAGADQWAVVRGEFVNEHIVPWVPAFFGAIVSDGTSEFFASAAGIGERLVAAAAEIHGTD